LRTTGLDVLSAIPGPGNVIAARDAYNSGREAIAQFSEGDVRKGLLSSAMAGLSGVGAVTGLPFGKMAGRAAKEGGRTLFSGAGPTGKKSGSGSFELDYYGQPVKILQNPSPERTKGFLNRSKYKAARRIIDPATGDVYIWDAADPALHKLVADQLGIDPAKMTGDMIGID
jgi:hypothetical protein